jgi:DNA-binding transcriptional LysR family regulator
METARFMPGLQVELLEAEPPELNSLLLSGEIGAAISSDDAGGAQSRIDHWDLFEERLLVLTQKDSRIAELASVPLEMLVGVNWLDRTGCEATSRYFTSLFPGVGEPKIAHRGHHLGHLQHMVSAGLGVMFWPEHAPHVASVVARPIDGDQLRRIVQLRVVQGRRYSPALEALVKIARVHDWAPSLTGRGNANGASGRRRRPRGFETCVASA